MKTPTLMKWMTYFTLNLLIYSSLQQNSTNNNRKSLKTVAWAENSWCSWPFHFKTIDNSVFFEGFTSLLKYKWTVLFILSIARRKKCDFRHFSLKKNLGNGNVFVLPPISMYSALSLSLSGVLDAQLAKRVFYLFPEIREEEREIEESEEDLDSRPSLLSSNLSRSVRFSMQFHV